MKKGTKRRIGMLVVLVALALTFQYTAKADSYLLENMGGSLFVGDELLLSDYFDEDALENVESTSIQYAVSTESGSKDCIQLSQDGTVKAVKEGTAVIEVSYLLKNDTTVHREAFQVSILLPEEVTADYGTTVWLTAFNMYYPWEPSDDEQSRYRYVFSNNSAAFNEDGELLIQGFQSFQVYLEKKNLKILVANVTVAKPKFEKTQMAKAKGTDAFYPTIEHYALFEVLTMQNPTEVQKKAVNIEWSSSDTKVASVSDKGILPLETGDTTIQAKITAMNGESCTIKAKLTVTDPKVTKEPFIIGVDVKKKLPLSGVCSVSTYDYPEGKDGYTYSTLSSDGKLYAFQVGEETIEVVVDGRTLSIQVVITEPSCKESSISMYKGISRKITLQGIDAKYSTVTYRIGNKAIAAVSKKGSVRAKKVGTTKVVVTADGKKMTVWIAVSTKKAYQAAKKEIAISKTKTHYSQAKRMSKGYYDCSSLVSRVYRQYGVYFGSKSGWSPTAAGIGQWCSTHGKVIARKGISYTKLVPGDLIFYSYTKNGRYRNISHIEMYVGDGMDVSASQSNNKVIHYGYNQYDVVLIARPTS